MKKMTPRLKTSHFSLYFSLSSKLFMISGATKPGVPQRGYKYLSTFKKLDSLKSIIFTSKSSRGLFMRRFSGFKSRWIIPFLWI